MYVNAWACSSRNHAWPGTYPSGGPVPRFTTYGERTPASDVLAPDLYLEYSTRSPPRFMRNGNPLFIPETSTNASNVLPAFGRFNAIGISPFFIERYGGSGHGIAAAYRVVAELTPAIWPSKGSRRSRPFG